MRKKRVGDLSRNRGQRKPGRGRTVAFEPLGNRIALSAGGVAPFVFEMNAAPRLFESPTVHTRTLSVDGEFTTLKQNAWQQADGAMSSISVVAGLDVPRSPIAYGSVNIVSTSDEGLRQRDGFGWRQQASMVATSELDRPALIVNGGFGAHRIAETRVAPANVQVAGTNLVVPGLLVARGDAVTLLVSATTMVGLPIESQNYFQIEGRTPFAGERNWSPRASVELATQQAVALNDDHHADRAPGATSANPGQIGGFTVPPRTGDAPAFLRGEPRAAEAGITGGWVARFQAETDGRSNSAPTQASPVTGQWAISKSELDEGLVELESPLAPRRKGRKLPGESVEATDHSHDNWSELQTLAEQVWSAWKEAWREFEQDGNEPSETPDAERTAAAERLVPGPTAAFNADVMDGLVELVVEHSGANDVIPPAREQLANDDAPVRIDAGVAIFQQFEIATAAEAAPPATARTAERKADGDERAEAEQPAEGQPISAAAVGAGLIIGLPFSLRWRRPDEDKREGRTPRLRS